jgi:hypothetical protein
MQKLIVFCSLMLMPAACTYAITSDQAMGFEVAQAWNIGAPSASEYVELSTTYVKAGLTSGKWSNHPYYPTLGTQYVQTDWSTHDSVSFWAYSEVVTNEQIYMAIFSDSNNGNLQWMDFFYTSFKVDWVGWKKLVFPFASFSRYETPAGWNKVDGIYFYTKLFNSQPNPYTVLYLDDIELSCTTLSADLNHDCVVDMEDLALMAAQWLVCTQPDPNECVLNNN